MNTGHNTKLVSNDGHRLNPLRRWIQLGVACAGFSVILFLTEYSATAINEPPDCNAVVITTNPVSQTVCLGSSVSFSAAATGSLPLYYQWQENGTNLNDGGSVSGSATPTLTLTGLGAGDSGSHFDAIVTNLCEGVASVATSTVATLTINTNASLTAIIGGIGPVCPQSTNTFSGTSGTGLSYSWSIAGQGTIIGASSSQTVTVASGLTNSFTLTLVVSSASCTNSTSATMPITPATAVIYGSSTVCSLSQNLYAGPEGPDLSYNWSISGSGTIVAATSDPVIFVAAGTSGSYTLTLTVACDSSSSSTSTTVSIYNSAIIVTQPVSQVACVGDLTTFSVVATGSSLSYQWQKNGVNLIDEANISGSATPTLTISNVGSTASSTCVWYTVNANNSSGVSVGSISAGQTYTYQASGCTWSDDVLHHSDPNGNQYFEGTCDIFVGRQVGGAGLICPSLVRVSLVGEVGGDCIQLGTNGTFVAPTSGTLTLYYNDSSFTDNEGAFTACVTPTSMTDTYDVVVTSGCNFETSVPVTLAISTPTATVSGSATICSGQSTMIQAALTGTAPWNLTWSDGFTQSNIMVSPAVRLINPISTITYTVTNLADAYCTNSASGSATITITSGGTVATPTFNPEGRQYLTPISVTVSCATAGASIHYTTNGLMPSLDDPSIGSGSSVTLSQTAILQARAFTNGYCASAIKAGLYQIGPMVVAGEYDSFFVQTNGVVWGWGDNTFAEITTNNYLYPGQYTEDSALSSVIPLGPVVTLSNVFALSAGGVHTLAVNTNGMVWSWGCGYAGNGNFEYYGPGVAGYNLVGPGGGENVGPLALIANLSNVVSVAASLVNLTTGTGAKFFDFSLVLKTNGTVWAWGDNSYGELGVGNSYVTEDVDYYEDGGFYPVESLTPTQTVGLSGVVAIAAGGDVGMALRSDGTVWVWGDYTDAFYNAYNALESYIPYESLDSSESTGTPMQVTGLSNIVAIALGYQHGMALDQNGFVWTWGWDSQGQLGTGDSYVNNSHGWAPMQIPGLTNVISIAAGDYHSVAVTSSGQVYTWGVNTNFNLTRQSLTGQLGTGTASNHVSTPQLVSGLSSIQSVSAGDAHTLALGTYRGVYLVWGWGDNTSLQLGSGTLGSQPTPVLVQLPIDTDNDGIPDWKKYQLGVDPLNPYQNGDGLLNGVNLAIGFSPVSSDVDASGNSNAFDLTAGYNPFDPSSFPTGDSTNIFPVITLVEPVGAVLIH